MEGIDQQLEDRPARERDPICGMEVAPEEAADSVVHAGRTYYFCSPMCAARFKADPESHAAPEQAEPSPASEQGSPVVPSATTGVPEGARRVRVDLPIEGLDCPVCVENVRRALLEVPGVERAQVNPTTRVATVAYDRSRADLSDLSRAVRGAGYQVGLATARLGIEGLH